MGAVPMSAMTESPFTLVRRYPSRSSVDRYLDRHYPILFATTGSCVRPHSSVPLGFFASGHGPCRLPRDPAAMRPFPTLSLQSLPGCLDPYPVVTCRCFHSLLPGRQRPLRMGDAFGSPDYPCLATSTGKAISRLQSFLYVQAPRLARPPGRSHRMIPHGQPGRLHHAPLGLLPPRAVVSLRV